MSDQTTHQSELNRLAVLTESAERGGGASAIEKRHALGKLTARERLDLLFDPQTFVEMNQLAESQAVDFGMQQKKVPGDGVVIGYGAIEGRLVFAYAQDATVLGGSVGTVHGQKICRIMDEALKVKAPIVGLFDSGGGRIHEGFFASKGVAGMFYRNTAASGVIPQISAMMGPCAGVSVYSPALTDFIVMVEGTSQMAITGPGVIKSVTGENATTASGRRSPSSRAQADSISARLPPAESPPRNSRESGAGPSGPLSSSQARASLQSSMPCARRFSGFRR